MIISWLSCPSEDFKCRIPLSSFSITPALQFLNSFIAPVNIDHGIWKPKLPLITFNFTKPFTPADYWVVGEMEEEVGEARQSHHALLPCGPSGWHCCTQPPPQAHMHQFARGEMDLFIFFLWTLHMSRCRRIKAGRLEWGGTCVARHQQSI